MPKYSTRNCELGFKSGLNVQNFQAKSGLGTEGESWHGTRVVKNAIRKTISETTPEIINLLAISIVLYDWRIYKCLLLKEIYVVSYCKSSP